MTVYACSLLYSSALRIFNDNLALTFYMLPARHTEYRLRYSLWRQTHRSDPVARADSLRSACLWFVLIALW